MGGSRHMAAGVIMDLLEHRFLKLHLTIGIQYAIYQTGLFIVLGLVFLCLKEPGVWLLGALGTCATLECARHMRRLTRLAKSLDKQQERIETEQDHEI